MSEAENTILSAALREAADSLRYTDRTTAPDEARAALAVAAFLRALPDYAVEIGGDRPLYSLHMLAVEAEEAVRG